MTKKKFLFYTGKRGGINHLTPLIEGIKKSAKIDYKIIFSDMHMDKQFGETKNEFAYLKRNSFYSPSLFKKDSFLYRSKSIAKGIDNNVRIIEKYKPDFVVVLGDRSELFSVGVPSMIYNIPIIHIYGGDVTQGCTDESTRHSISMLSNYHFVSNYKSFKNLVKFGIDKKNILDTGLISLHKIQKSKNKIKDLYNKLNLDLKKKLIVSILHPETWNDKNHKKNVDVYFDSLKKINHNLIIIYPCSDPGYKYIIRKIKKISKKRNVKVFKNIEAEFFYEILQFSDLFIGNSSTGILECGFFNVPVINVGIRQKGRYCDNRVIHSSFNIKRIQKNINNILKKKKKMGFNKSFFYFKKNGLNKALKFLYNIKSDKFHKQILKLSK